MFVTGHGRRLRVERCRWIVLLIILLFGGIPAARARPLVELLESRPGVTVVRVRWPALADSTQAAAEFAVAVPTRAPVTATVKSLRWYVEPPEPVVADALLEISPPRVARGVPLVGVRVAGTGGILEAVEIVIQHPPRGVPAQQLQAAREQDVGAGPDAATGVVNPRLQRLLEAGAGVLAQRHRVAAAVAEDPFAVTRNWVRLELASTGVYEFDGNALSLMACRCRTWTRRSCASSAAAACPIDANPEYPDSLQRERSGFNEVPMNCWGTRTGSGISPTGCASMAWVPPPGSTGSIPRRRDCSTTSIRSPPGRVLAHVGDFRGCFALPGGAPAAGRGGGRAGSRAHDHAALVRLHMEESSFDDRGKVKDGLLWDNRLDLSRNLTFLARDPVPDARPRWWSICARCATARPEGISLPGDGLDERNNEHTAASSRRATTAAGSASWPRCGVVPGSNILTLRNTTAARNPTAPALIALDSFDVLYLADLRMNAGSPLEFAHWRSEVPGAEAVRFEVRLAGRRR